MSISSFIIPVLTLTLHRSLCSARVFKGTFSSSPEPFNIDVEPEFIELTRQRAALTRFADDLDQPDFVDGAPRSNATTVRDYWANEFDWFEVQDVLNKEFSQFTITVDISPASNYSEPVPLHFVHHRSERDDAIPLLFIHGWPGSFIEVGPIVDLFTSPPNASAPAFHVVAPSIPGFASSPPPTKPGYGYIEAAHSFDALMQQLGYRQYVIQAGDAGGIIMRYQAHLYSDSVVSGLNNFWIVSPTIEDRKAYASGTATDDEKAVIELLDYFMIQHWGYGQIHQTRPLRLAHAMTDSPVGLAMWIYDALHPSAWDVTVWTPKEIITWTMMLWIPGPYGGFSLYKQGALAGAFNATHFFDLPYVQQPMAISQFPKDIWYRTPLEWAQQSGNVKVRYVHETGGHFPAWENPELLIKDVWAFFGDTELSGTKTFAPKGERGPGKDEL